MSDLSPQSQDVLNDARDVQEPTAQDKARVRAAIAMRLTAATTATAAAATASKTGAASSASNALGASVAKLLGVLAVGAGVVTGIVVTQQQTTPASPRTPATVTPSAPAAAPVRSPSAAAATPAVAPVLVAPVTEPAPAAPSPVPASPRARAASSTATTATNATVPVIEASQTTAPATPHAPAASSILENVRTLREANALLSAGDASAALARLDERASSLNDSAFAEEASALRILCLCATGQTARMATERSRFVVDYPASVHMRRVMDACPPR